MEVKHLGDICKINGAEIEIVRVTRWMQQIGTAYAPVLKQRL